MTLKCPKCGVTSGGDWSQCNGECPMPASPHHRDPERGDSSSRTLPLLDVAIGEDGYVELFFENRRVIFDRDSAGQEIWAIASQPPSAQDGSGRIDAETSTADVIARATRGSTSDGRTQ